MKKNMKLLILGLALALVIPAGAVFSAGKTAVSSNTATTTSQTTQKITQNDATNTVLKKYPDAKVVEATLIKEHWEVKIKTAKDARTVWVGANSGKIVRDFEGTAPVNSPTTKNINEAKVKATKVPKVKPTPKPTKAPKK